MLHLISFLFILDEQYLSPVVDEDIWALDVSVQEIPFMAVWETIQQLPHDRSVHRLGELHQTRIQQTVQVVVWK